MRKYDTGLQDTCLDKSKHHVRRHCSTRVFVQMSSSVHAALDNLKRLKSQNMARSGSRVLNRVARDLGQRRRAWLDRTASRSQKRKKSIGPRVTVSSLPFMPALSVWPFASASRSARYLLGERRTGIVVDISVPAHLTDS